MEIKLAKESLLTFIIPKTASAQLVLNGLSALLGLQSQMKSTPHMFPLWLRWLTHCRTFKKRHKKLNWLALSSSSFFFFFFFFFYKPLSGQVNSGAVKL